MDQRLNRFLAVMIIITGILGLILGSAGLVGVWVARPYAYRGLDGAITTAESTIETSINIMEVTSEAMGITVKSLESLENIITTTSETVAKTKPYVEKINEVVGSVLPATLEAARDSLEFAQKGALVIDKAIDSLENFREMASKVPLLGEIIDPVEAPQTDEGQTLHESLGAVVKNLEAMPQSLGEVSSNLDQADNELWAIEENLNEMATSVNEIRTSMENYQQMIDRGIESLENILATLLRIQENLSTILIAIAIFLTLFFLWLIGVQVIVLIKGWEMLKK